VTDTPAPGGPGAPRRRPAATGDSFTRSILGAFARGTGLIAVALVIGVVLLQWSDASTDAAAGGQPPVIGTPAAPPETTTTTAAAPAGPKGPADLAVLVLNASGKNNQATPMSERLGVVGYRTLTPGTANRRPDSVVLCKPGLDREAAALVAATGLPAKPGVLDDAAAAGIEGVAQADCLVIIGSR
jgi:hypothetical protein